MVKKHGEREIVIPERIQTQWSDQSALVLSSYSFFNLYISTYINSIFSARKGMY